MKIKICGITRVEDAVCVAMAGGWAIGFIFYKNSPRYLPPDEAGLIVKSVRKIGMEKILAVGVFVNASLSEIENAISAAHLDMVQLHGDEGFEFCNAINIPVIKAIRPLREEDLNGLEKLESRNYLLIDAFDEKKRGGTGKRANLGLALMAKEKGKVILSGGLDYSNIVASVRKVEPYAIDLSSSVEARPGVKDLNKLKLLFKVVREAAL